MEVGGKAAMALHGILRWKNFAAAAGLLALAALLLVLVGREPAQSAPTQHEPADKAQVAAANDRTVAPGTETTVLQETVRTSRPSDLMLQLSSECGVFIDRFEIPPATVQFAFGTVEARILVDGNPVPVTAATTGPPPGPGTSSDDGWVELCERDFARAEFADPSVVNENGEERGTQAFTWVRFNAGNGLHNIEVKVRFTQSSSGNITTSGRIGKRTLIIEPTKMPNDQDATPIG
jgi:hypothetical protein